MARSVSSTKSHPSIPELRPSILSGKAAPAKLEALDPSRWTLPSQAQGTTEELERAQAMLSHQSLRQSNVELLNKFGGNAWRVSNFLLEQDSKHLSRQVEMVSSDIEDLNRSRKSAQDAAAQKLTGLDAKWTELVGGNLQLEVANLALESDVIQLRQRYAALQKELAQMQ